MCIPIMLAGLALSAVGSLATAAMTSAQAKQQALIEQRQLETEIRNEKIKGMADTNDRLEEFRKAEAVNRAVLSASGVDVNYSYLGGILPENRRVARRDIRGIEFNMGQQIGRKKYEIGVAGWRARTEARGAWIGAGAQILGNVGSAFAQSGSTSSLIGRGP